ncbi:hypothetical protein Vadar_032520 [Vaccinium darrowii]|uniref:Uncharacterized protein n=1 Tax=Vaccinium darrowii TaxID=229202 RepID=A0ACB7Z237_9ERIC|nr:hypothetical protein Vadar_032520 [Vaccinium darrowii]
MGPTSKSRKISEEVKLNEAEDRITNLPEDLISHILSFLPAKCAVVTSILSTKWRWMWTSISCISVQHGRWCDESFVKFVNHVLHSLDRSNVDKFIVDCYGISRRFEASHVNSWVTTALSHNVRELDIHMPPLELSDWLPEDLFTCKTLVTSDEYKIELNTPSLVYFQYSGLLAERYGIDTLSSLVKARLDFEDPGLYENTIEELLQGISNVQTLHISGNSIKGLFHSASYSSYPDNWDWHPLKFVPICLFRLKVLDIQKFRGQPRELKLVKYFLSNAKVLKTLRICCEKTKE